MPIMYYGSKISPNMTKTPEGYLICTGVNIGRTGWMDYLGEELGITEMSGKVIRVYRNQEELFKKATMASFEGKPVTNNHPTQNLDVNTVSYQAKGHATNVRQDGDCLVADLFITDPGLISEIENGKREVSCGYECTWVPLDDGNMQFEQKDILGNHVAVVQNGRAGARVAIKDSKPERSKKMKITKKMLQALGFKAFAADAEPEELAAAMDALGEEGETSNVGGAGGSEGEKNEIDAIKQLIGAVNSLSERISKLEQSDMEVHKEVGADEELTALEKEVTQDADPESEGSETVEPDAQDEEPTKPTMDSLSGFIQMMKPIIMAIPDEKTRNETAKAFSKSVRDARGVPGKNGYGDILNASVKNKKTAMDSAKQQTIIPDAASKAAEAWNKNNSYYKEVK